MKYNVGDTVRYVCLDSTHPEYTLGALGTVMWVGNEMHLWPYHVRMWDYDYGPSMDHYHPCREDEIVALDDDIWVNLLSDGPTHQKENENV